MSSEGQHILGPGGFPKPTPEYEQAERDRWINAATGDRPVTAHDPLCELLRDHDRDQCVGNIAKVRADEAKRNAIAEVERAWAERADLRARVEALHTTGSVSQPRLYINRDQVLALLDGSSDE